MPGPGRDQQSYRHEAFLWNGRADFVDGLLPFVEEGVDAGEAVMVAAVPTHAEWLVKGLGRKASKVQFVDVTRLGRNPARIIPACQQFLQHSSGYGRPARAVGEPIWEGRPPEELLECQLHEALMNLAVDPKLPFWVLCPYDAGSLDSDVLAEASRSHPVLATTESYQGSHSYRGQDHAQAMFAAELPAMERPAIEIEVTRTSLPTTVTTATLRAAYANFGSTEVVGFTQAVRRLAEDSLRRGARQVTLRMWERHQALICELADATWIDDLLVGRRAEVGEHDPVWLANQVCDLVQVRSSVRGTTIRLHLRKKR